LHALLARYEIRRDQERLMLRVVEQALELWSDQQRLSVLGRIGLVGFVGDQRRGSPEPAALAVGARTIRKIIGKFLRVVGLGERARVLGQFVAQACEI